MHNNCKHSWKITYGLYKTYKDCEWCGLKWEDYLEGKDAPPIPEEAKKTEREQAEEDLIEEFEKMLREFNGDLYDTNGL